MVAPWHVGFNYAVHVPRSWAHDVHLQLPSRGDLLPVDCEVMPGATAAQLQWKRSVVQPPLQREALAQDRLEIAAVPSPGSHLEHQPHLVCASQVHGGRLAPHVIREWRWATAHLAVVSRRGCGGVVRARSG